MRLVFVCWPFEDQGSSLVVRGYSEAARALGHEVAVYACPYDKIPLNYSLAVGSADAVVFLFEWTTRQYYGDRLDLELSLVCVGRVWLDDLRTARLRLSRGADVVERDAEGFRNRPAAGHS